MPKPQPNNELRNLLREFVYLSWIAFTLPLKCTVMQRNQYEWDWQTVCLRIRSIQRGE